MQGRRYFLRYVLVAGNELRSFAPRGTSAKLALKRSNIADVCPLATLISLVIAASSCGSRSGNICGLTIKNICTKKRHRALRLVCMMPLVGFNIGLDVLNSYTDFLKLDELSRGSRASSVFADGEGLCPAEEFLFVGYLQAVFFSQGFND